jgi:hypothetical protein
VNWVLVVAYIFILSRIIGASPKGVTPPWVTAAHAKPFAPQAALPGPADVVPKPPLVEPASSRK